MFLLTSALLGFAGSIVRHSFLSCSSACGTAAGKRLLEFHLSRETFGAGETPARHLFTFKVLGSGNCENWPQRVFINLTLWSTVPLFDQRGCACPCLVSQQARPVLTHNGPEIALRLTLYFYVCFTRNVFSRLIIVVLCGKVISIESD